MSQWTEEEAGGTATTDNPGYTTGSGADVTPTSATQRTNTVADAAAAAKANETNTEATEALPDSYGAAKTAAENRETPEFAKYEATADGPETVAGENFQTAETEVAGHLNKYLDPDSVLNRMAVSQAREQAQAVGGSLSSMERGATQQALYKQAGEFAMKDQEHASQTMLQEQQGENKKRSILQEAQVAGDLNIQTAKIRDDQQRVEQGWDATMQGMAAKDAEDLTIMRENGETARANALNTLNDKINQDNISSDLSIMTMNNVTTRLNNWSLMVQETSQDTEWMNMMGGVGSTGVRDFWNDQLRVVTVGAEFDAGAAGQSAVWAPWIKNLWEGSAYGNEAY